MDLGKIKKLIELVKESGITELEVKSGDEGVRISRAAPNAVAAPLVVADSAPTEEDAPAQSPASGAVVAAPMSGTFYRAPAPGEPPFADVGDTVAVGDVLCIIESMKMMNAIDSDHAGEIVAVLVDNGQPIESGTGLFRLR